MFSSSPLFSIIIPIFNAEQYLKTCINSIISQTYTHFELLLIDDGSTDSSYDICKEYESKDKRIKVYRKNNGGVSTARNLGIDKAKGEWIAFIDSDDYVNKDFLYNYKLVIDKKAELVCTGYVGYYSNNKIIKVKSNNSDNKSEIIYYQFKYRLLGFLWCKCFKRQIIIENGIRFNEKFKLMEDLEFIYNFLSHCTYIKSVNTCSYNYRQPNNFYNKYKKVSTFDCLCSILNLINSLDLNKEHLNDMINSYLRNLEYAVIRDYRNNLHPYITLKEYKNQVDKFGPYIPNNKIFYVLNHSKFLKNNLSVTHVLLTIIYTYIKR